jgi:sirohydrochlorin cobaltochelatase
MVQLAYLELMQPSLPEALDALAAEKISAVRVVPVFFGSGGHVKQDLPRLVENARAKHSMKIEIEAPIGDQAQVIEAIAGAIAFSSKKGGRASP